MTYALIGCGRVSPNHIRAALENQLDIVALCDLKEKKMQETAAKLPKPVAFYTDYRRLLAESGAQMVAIATDSGEHAEIALAAIEAGKHVLIEKPMALSMADARRICQAAQESGVTVGVCHQNRFNTAVVQLRKALEAGRFGKLSHGAVTVRWNRSEAYYDQAAWRGTWAQDGGTLMNQCIHGIDLLRWMMGDEISEVCGMTARRLHEHTECEDIGMAVIRFKNGALGTVEGTANVYPRDMEETLSLFGQHGTVKLGGGSVNKIDRWVFADGEEDMTVYEEKPENVYGNGHVWLYADFLAAIRENRPPLVDTYAGMAALELVLAIYKSQKEGCVVRLPLDNFDCNDMKENTK